MFLFLRNRIYILFLIFLFSCMSENRAITKQEIDFFVKTVDESFVRKDLAAIEDIASDSLEIHIKVNNKEDIRYNKKEYLALLKENWARTENYLYQKLSSNINISDRNKAIVRERVLEKFIIDAHSYSVLSDNTIEIRLVGGKLVATSIEAELNFQVEQ